MTKKDTINRTQMASLIHYNHPDLKIKDITQVLKGQEEVIEYGLDTMQRIKFGKLFTIDPIIKPEQLHYDAVNKKHITLPKRVRFTFKSLKRLKDLEKDHQM